MGYLTSDHIRQFVRGQRIVDIRPLTESTHEMVFENGERLRFMPIAEDGCVRVIATPVKANGDIKQTTEIKPWRRRFK